MRFRLRVIALAVVCLGVAASAARAQDEPDLSESARFRFGALRFTPSIALSNVGVDNNVFNESADPKRDNTAAVGPAADLWLRMGRSRLTGKVSGQYLYFNKYDNQRSWNTANEGRWEFPLGRITPFVRGSLSDTADRPGFEIDSRARRNDKMYGFGSRLRFSSKTGLLLSAKRTTYKFDETETFLGVDLAQRLNRRSDSELMDLRVRLTPLTTFVVRSEAIQDRFDFEQERNADSYSVMPGFELRPEALISGEAFVGVRRFNTLNDTLPDYTGLVSSVKVKYSLAATRAALTVSRDLTYSYEVDQPYYALTDMGLEITQRITTAWDLVARGALQALAYKNVSTSPALPDRTDHSRLLGGGIGYRVGETVRVGFDVNYYRRQVDRVEARSYEGLRFGASIAYGLPQ